MKSDAEGLKVSHTFKATCSHYDACVFSTGFRNFPVLSSNTGRGLSEIPDKRNVGVNVDSCPYVTLERKEFIEALLGCPDKCTENASSVYLSSAKIVPRFRGTKVKDVYFSSGDWHCRWERKRQVVCGEEASGGIFFRLSKDWNHFAR